MPRTDDGGEGRSDLSEQLGIRPFNARSLVLSVLLGLEPPALPARSLVALAEVFAIAGGTMRTALSRMVAAGELAASDGEYRLAGPLLDRKAAQDIGRRPAPVEWDGTWWIAAVTSPRRTVPQRRAFRTRMANLRMGELRPETWMRPANLDMGPTGGDGLAVVRGPLHGENPAVLAARLWPLDALGRRANVLVGLVEAARPELERGDPTALTHTIGLAAATVRFLRAEPLLPPTLVPADWPVERLRAEYRTFDRTFGRLLAATVRAATS